MKKLLLTVGIVLLIAGVLSLSFAALNLVASRRTLDGSASLYSRMQHRAILFLGVGLALTAGGIACLVLRART